MSTLLFFSLALRRLRFSSAAKLGLLLIAGQAALFDGVILHSTGGVAQARPAVTAPAANEPQKPSSAQCREETITLDEGYGLRGQETRMICGR
jgi:hypothetical protein